VQQVRPSNEPRRTINNYKKKKENNMYDDDLTNCPRCGEDSINNELCRNCEWQDNVDEWLDDEE
jgi:ribosomal protein L32